LVTRAVLPPPALVLVVLAPAAWLREAVAAAGVLVVVGRFIVRGLSGFRAAHANSSITAW
jgi:hypothetical protein